MPHYWLVMSSGNSKHSEIYVYIFLVSYDLSVLYFTCACIFMKISAVRQIG